MTRTRGVPGSRGVAVRTGASVHRVGGVGGGHRSRLLDDAVLLGQYAIGAGSFALAIGVGVSRETLFEVITSDIGGPERVEVEVTNALDDHSNPADVSPKTPSVRGRRTPQTWTKRDTSRCC